MREHWHPFVCIKASNVIYYYALKLEYEVFLKEISTHGSVEKITANNKCAQDSKIKEAINKHSEQYNSLHQMVLECENYFNKPNNSTDIEKEQKFIKLITEDISLFRKEITETLQKDSRAILSDILQRWGNMIRRYDSVIENSKKMESDKAPACLARKINCFIKLIRRHSENEIKQNNTSTNNAKTEAFTHIVIDALRNPYEVLYFRERYASFYLMSINTDEQIRKQKLVERGFDIKEIEELDKEESAKRDFRDSYSKIDINKCIELSDIHITHNGIEVTRNRELVNRF